MRPYVSPTTPAIVCVVVELSELLSELDEELLFDEELPLDDEFPVLLVVLLVLVLLAVELVLDWLLEELVLLVEATDIMPLESNGS